MSSSFREEEESCSIPIKDDGGGGRSPQYQAPDGSSVGSSWAPRSPPRRGDTASEPIFNSSSPPREEETSTEEQQSKTLHERVVQAASATGSSALLSTLELLKFAGGATLSTTGKIMAPPLVLFWRAFLQSFEEYLDYISPQRLKDWFRIVSSSVSHVITVVKDTPKGIIFRSRILHAGGSVVDLLSSDASRQVFVDGMAAVVKLAEALHTPETKALLEQTAVLGCRIVDAASVGHNKQLMHDFSEAVWAGLELCSDPATTVALAEVTAYLCHALEMEEAIYRNKKPTAEAAAQRRYDRNQYQRHTYVDPDLIRDPDSTVEQVIRSSLGGGRTGAEADTGSLPSNVAWDRHESEKDWTSLDGGAKPSPPEDFNDVLRASVHLKYLEKEISQRADNMERQQMLRTTVTTLGTQSPLEQSNHEKPTKEQTEARIEEKGDEIEDLVVVETVENDESDDELDINRQSTFTTSNIKAEDTKQEIRYDDNLESPLSDKGDASEEPSRRPPVSAPPIPTVHDESASSRFYQSLDEIMIKKRLDALADKALELDMKAKAWYPKAAAAAGAGNAHDTIKKLLKATQGPEGSTRARLRGPTSVPVRLDGGAQKRINQKLALLVFVVMATWFLLGCYGLWAIIYPTVRSIGPISRWSGPRQPVQTGSRETGEQSSNEIVIRIVKEVIHRAEDGSIIETLGTNQVEATKVDYGRVAECVEKAIG